LSTWYGIRGRVKYRSGTSGVETFTSGTKIIQIHAFSAAGGNVVMPAKGSPIDPVIITLPAGAWWGLQENHINHSLEGTGSQLQIQFNTTTAYFVEYTDESAGG
jgi:hypothetical protein